MRNPLFLSILAALALASCGGGERPNVLLLTLDTLRADALGCYGHPIVQTPNLDRLAAEGALFGDAICQIPATLTSHTAIMTGRHPKTNGVRFRSAQVPESETTLAELFSANGYQTAAYISALVLHPRHGLDQGFDEYYLGSMQQNGRPAAPERRADETIGGAIQYLENRGEAPFFLWVHLYDPHTPYDAPEPYTAMYDEDYDGPLRGTVAEITRLTADRGAGVSERDLKHLEALYHGEVTYMDAQIGRLFHAMEEGGLFDNTIVAALADHGEALGERGHFFHGTELYRHSMRIPLLIRWPPGVRAGARIGPLVQSIDLFPTLLELAGIEGGGAAEGRSLAGLIRTGDENAPPEAPGFMETEADPVSPANKLFALRTDEYKFIENSAHRRPETPLGLYAEIPLKGPAVIMARLRGDESVRLMAHIRYRTEALYASRDPAALAELPSTAVYAETVGTDPLHNEARSNANFLDAPEGWRLQMTPDLYRVAKEYGESRGWPTEWMVIEGAGVDASLPHVRDAGEFEIDQIELYAPGLRFPDTPKFRDPFWIVQDFEGPDAVPLADSGEGPPHQTAFSWREGPLFGGNRHLHVRIEYSEIIEPNDIDEIFAVLIDPDEETNLLQSEQLGESDRRDVSQAAEDMRALLDKWRNAEGGALDPVEMDESTREALRALGYIE